MKSTFEQLRDIRQADAEQSVDAMRDQRPHHIAMWASYPHVRNCKHCTTMFGSYSKAARYCGNVCRQAEYRYREGANVGNEACYFDNCAECGETVARTRPATGSSYCDNLCRQKAYRRRRRENEVDGQVFHK